MRLKNKLSKLINRGTSQLDSIQDIRVLRMINIYTLLAIPICITFTLNSILLKNTFTAITTACYVLIFIIIYKFIRFNKINTIRAILYVSSFIPVFINREVFSASVYFQILLLALTVAYSLVLRQKETKITILYSVVSIGLIYLAGSNFYFTNITHESAFQSIHESVMFWQSITIIMMAIHIYWYETNRIIRLQSETNLKLDSALYKQKELYETLNGNKKFYEEVLNNLQSEIAVFDKHCKYIYLNPAIESSKEKRKALLGKKIGKKTKDYENFNIKNKATLKHRERIIKKCIEAKKTITIEETVFDKQNNQKHVIRQFIYVKHKHNNSEQILTLGVNITEIKNMQKDLIKAKDQAMVAAKAKQHFMSVVSHEMRTPLNAVIGLSSLIISNLKDNTQIQNLETLRFSANILLTIINDILDFNDLEFGNTIIERSNFKLNKLIYNIIDIQNNTAINKKLPLIVNINSDVPEIFYGDQYRLAQILSNLLSNAIKFTETGYVKLFVDFDKVKNTITFHIIDTGIGIEDNKLDTIFTSFQQANINVKRQYGGTGLGLTISKKIAGLMNAKLSVESVLGKGSTFKLTVPYECCSLPENKPDAVFVKNLRNKHILLVEDNEVNQMVAKKFLTKWNAKVTIANNGEESLEYLSRNTYDLILMDLHMPIMDGFEAISYLKNNPNFSTPIMVLSADVSENSAIKTEQLNVQGILYKPFEPEDLYKKICLSLNSPLYP